MGRHHREILSANNFHSLKSDGQHCCCGRFFCARDNTIKHHWVPELTLYIFLPCFLFLFLRNESYGFLHSDAKRNKNISTDMIKKEEIILSTVKNNNRQQDKTETLRLWLTNGPNATTMPMPRVLFTFWRFFFPIIFCTLFSGLFARCYHD